MKQKKEQQQQQQQTTTTTTIGHDTDGTMEAIKKTNKPDVTTVTDATATNANASAIVASDDADEWSDAQQAQLEDALRYEKQSLHTHVGLFHSPLFTLTQCHTPIVLFNLTHSNSTSVSLSMCVTLSPSSLGVCLSRILDGMRSQSDARSARTSDGERRQWDRITMSAPLDDHTQLQLTLPYTHPLLLSYAISSHCIDLPPFLSFSVGQDEEAGDCPIQVDSRTDRRSRTAVNVKVAYMHKTYRSSQTYMLLIPKHTRDSKHSLPLLILASAILLYSI